MATKIPTVGKQAACILLDCFLVLVNSANEALTVMANKQTSRKVRSCELRWQHFIIHVTHPA